MLTELDEEKWVTERAANLNYERLKMKIKYLEKDNKDLQMDLDDVEATLQINKNIINWKWFYYLENQIQKLLSNCLS